MTYYDRYMQPQVRQTPLLADSPTYTGKKPVTLLILDGWGIGPDYEGNAVKLANTPNIDKLWQTYAHTQLGASGVHVGLPEGVDGNSETGHMNIGAGGIVQQSLPRVNNAIQDGSFFNNEVLLQAIDHAQEHGSKIHLVGLVGPGFVHSSTAHLYALLELAKKQQFNEIYVHAFTDGRDAAPDSGLQALTDLEAKMAELGVGTLASITGRFYGMDRDRNWDRTELAYDALTLGKGMETNDWPQAMKDSYAKNITDEFIEPIIIQQNGSGTITVDDNDAVIFFNFRVDRPRQLTWAFVLPDFEYRDLTGSSSGKELDLAQLDTSQVVNFRRNKIPKNIYFATMTDYDQDLTNPKAFARIDIKVNLGQVLSEAGVKQLRLTETEKEKMVTYYIDGKREDPYPGEHAIIYPSKKTKTYAEIPEMSAVEVADELVRQIETAGFDAAIVNICNGDMVGHTGDLQAGIKACEVVDEQLGKVVAATLAAKGVLLITADHGNSEEMINRETGAVDTKHSTFPVPFILVGQEFEGNQVLEEGILGDVAPTMLKLMGISQPAEMTGKSLV